MADFGRGFTASAESGILDSRAGVRRHATSRTDFLTTPGETKDPEIEKPANGGL
jgi:hypothetical protein